MTNQTFTNAAGAASQWGADNRNDTLRADPPTDRPFNDRMVFESQRNESQNFM